jgi:hypothetical protein
MSSRRLLNPENKIIEFNEVKSFMKKYNLTSRVFLLLNGSIDQYKGWRRFEEFTDINDTENNLRNLLNKTFSRAKRRIIKNSPEFLNLLDRKYPNIPLIEQIYLFEKQMDKPPTCVVCGKNVFFHSEKRGYYITCSKRCMNGKRNGHNIKELEKINHIVDNKSVLVKLLNHQDIKSLSKKFGVSKTMVGNYARKYGINDGYLSNLERSFFEWISQYNINFKTDRKILSERREIDFYFEEKHIGVELNGLYFHSEISGGKGKKYHKSKTDECKSKGIRLLSIFEDEWYDKQNIVKNIIKTALGIQTIKVGGRKLQIKEAENRETKEFLQENHIQGICNFSISIGAFLDNKMVGVMVFGNPTRQSIYQYELKRFCSDGNIYPGMANRLFKYFIKNYSPKNIVSFCDKRYFLGHTYEKMGFSLDAEIPPDYSYTKDYRTRHHKSNFRLKRIQKMVPNQNIISKTEYEWMKELGYDRVWDSGKLRFVWHRAYPVDIYEQDVVSINVPASFKKK